MRNATYLSRLSLRALGLSPALFALTTACATFACSSPVDFGERGVGGSGGSAGSTSESSGGIGASGGTIGSTGGDGSGCADGCGTGGTDTGAVGGQGSAVGGGPATTGGTGSAVGGGPADTGGTASAVGGGPASGGGPNSTGGTGGTGEPATPSAVGFSLTLSPPDPDLPNVGSRTCTAGTNDPYTYVIGAPAPGKTIVDGTNGVTVQCNVRGDGAGALPGNDSAQGTFYASASGTDENGHKPVSITVSGEILDKANPAANAGGLRFFSPDTTSLRNLDDFPLCTIGPVATLKSGAILTDIDCPLIGSVDDTTIGCKVHGTVAFEYCRFNECGDGVVQEPEECDDGASNGTSDSLCSSSCTSAAPQ